MNDLKLRLLRLEAFVMFELRQLRRSIPPDRPDVFTLILIGEDQMAQKNVYRLQLPVLGPSDVVNRELTISKEVSDGALEVDQQFNIDPTTTVLEEVKILQGQKGLVELVDIDENGNRSEPRSFPYDAQDVTPPPQPGEFALDFVREEVDDVV